MKLNIKSTADPLTITYDNSEKLFASRIPFEEGYGLVASRADRIPVDPRQFSFSPFEPRAFQVVKGSMETR